MSWTGYTAGTLAIYYFLHREDNVPFTYLAPTLYVGTLPPPYPAVEDPENLPSVRAGRQWGGALRGLVNAFPANMKKALHLRIDLLLPHQYGLFQHYRIGRNFY